MEASARGVNGPLKRHVGLCRNFVQRGLGRDFMKCHAFKVWSAHAADQALHGQQCRLTGVVDSLPLPSHTPIRTYVRLLFKGGKDASPTQKPAPEPTPPARVTPTRCLVSQGKMG